jgi:hypothetical protein
LSAPRTTICGEIEVMRLLGSDERGYEVAGVDDLLEGVSVRERRAAEVMREAEAELGIPADRCAPEAGISP